MLHLFLDDSGKEGQQTNPWVCMAGYLADNQTLLGLYGKWTPLLIKHGIAEIHMKDLIPMLGMYKSLGWTTEVRDSAIREFIDAINETKMYGIGVAVQTSSWRKFKNNHPKLPWGTAQRFCLERIMRRVIEQLHAADMDDALSLVFDTDPEFGANRFDLFCALMGHDQRAARRLSSITFGHPKHYPGLQCADLLVWETRKELMQKAGGYQSTKRWQAMFTKMPDYHLEYTVGEKWDDDEFEKALQSLMLDASSPSSPATPGGAAE